MPRGAGHLEGTEKAQQRLSLSCSPSRTVALGNARPRRVLTSVRVSTRARHRDRAGGGAAPRLRCHRAEPGSGTPPFPEET